MKWDRRFLELAEHVAQWSKDSSTKVGCVLTHPDRTILSLGYNGFPRGVDEHFSRLGRPIKYMYTVHSEQNAVFNAVRNGTAIKGYRAHVTHLPCAECAKALIQSGCTHVVTYHPESYPELYGRLVDSYTATQAMFAESGVELTLVSKSQPKVDSSEDSDEDEDQ